MTFPQVSTAGVLDTRQPVSEALERVGANVPPNGALQVRTSYSTAVHVVKPRVLQEVVRKCLEEAAIAGDEFYYSWKQGGEIIEGPTIGAAIAIVRNFGNCAIDCTVEDKGDYYVFNAAFIDLETGFNITRPFRQAKAGPKKKDGTAVYKGDRGEDIVFQIGTSKAQRNVALQACPKWIVSRVMERAKENVTKKISDMGIEKARAMVSKKASAIGVTVERIGMVYGKETAWDIEAIVQISSALRAIEDGTESVDSLFPIKGSESPAPATTQAAKEPEAKPTPKTEGDGFAEASAKLRDSFLAQTKNVKTIDSLKKVEEKFMAKLDAGEFTVADQEILIKATAERREELNAAKKQG